MQKYYLAFISLCFSSLAMAQSVHYNWFIRTPQVVNFNFSSSKINYSPVVSTGFGVSHRLKYLELATFISQNNSYGYYTFFGSTLKSKNLDENWKLNINWFGELTFVPQQSDLQNSFTETAGLCFFINHPYKWGNIGIPLCIGVAYNQGTFSLNNRTILNLSIPIK